MASLSHLTDGNGKDLTSEAPELVANSSSEDDEGSAVPVTAAVRAPTIHLEMPFGEFIRACTEGYLFDYSWNIAPPVVPDTPILFTVPTVGELLKSTDPLGVMEVELDAMSIGVLDSIPLSYPLLRPQVVEEIRRLSVENERRVEEAKRRAAAEGLSDQSIWNPGSVNPDLDAEDAELLDTDIDVSMMLERDKPSLTQLQRPLYTDMGLVSPEQRHLERVARIIPDELRNIVSLSPTQLFQGRSDGLSQEGPLLPSFLSSGSGSGSGSVGGSLEDTAAQWKDGVVASFKMARSLDSSYEKMLKVIAGTKLGLDGGSRATLVFVQKLWKLLFTETTRDQQCRMWNVFCQFSNSYGGTEESEEVLRRAVELLELPHRDSWFSVVADFVRLLKEHVSSLPGGVEERRAALRISEKELTSGEGGGLGIEVPLDSLLRKVQRELGFCRQSGPIYPVEVVPLYPAGFQEYAERLNGGGEGTAADVVLGEVETSLHHVVLPGAVVGKDFGARGPHVLVANTNLLVANKESDVEPADGVIATCHTSRENTFERLVLDNNSTSGYLFQLCSVGPTTEGPTPAGVSGLGGRYAVYRRLALRDLYVKAPDAKHPPMERYAVVFAADGSLLTESRKRSRDELGPSEDPAFHPTG